MAYINENRQYTLNIYDAQCNLAKQIPLPFSSMGAGDVPERELTDLLVNDEEILFFAEEEENSRHYWLYAYDRLTDTWAEPIAVHSDDQYIVPLAICGADAAVSVQNVFPNQTVTDAETDGGPRCQLHYVDAEGNLTLLETMDRQIIWRRADYEKERITLLLRDPFHETYSLRTYLFIR